MLTYHHTDIHNPCSATHAYLVGGLGPQGDEVPEGIGVLAVRGRVALLLFVVDLCQCEGVCDDVVGVCAYVRLPCHVCIHMGR